MISISIVLIIISSITRAISNKIQFHYEKSVFRNKKWFNPLTSWKNKWKLNSIGNPFINNKGENIERFLGSSTIFVVFTDAWHLFESISKYTLIGAFVTWAYFSLVWWWLLILVAIMVFIFHIFFTWIFSKK